MPDPIQISLEALTKSGLDDSCTLACFWTKSVWPKPDDRTKSDLGWFCTIWPRTSMEACNRIWKSETGSGLGASCQKPGSMISAHQLATRPDAFGQTLTRPSRSNPGQFCKVWSMPLLEKMELYQMREVGLIHIWSGLILAARWL